MMEFIRADFESATAKGGKVRLTFDVPATERAVFNALRHTGETVTLCVDPIQVEMEIDLSTGEVRERDGEGQR